MKKVFGRWRLCICKRGCYIRDAFACSRLHILAILPPKKHLTSSLTLIQSWTWTICSTYCIIPVLIRFIMAPDWFFHTPVLLKSQLGWCECAKDKKYRSLPDIKSYQAVIWGALNYTFITHPSEIYSECSLWTFKSQNTLTTYLEEKFSLRASRRRQRADD